MTSRHFSFSLGVAAFLLATALRAFAQQPVPRNLSEEDRAQTNLMDQVTTPGSGYFWECYPDVAGFTATPPADSRFPGEFENVSGVFWAWPFFGCQIPEITEGIRNHQFRFQDIVDPQSGGTVFTLEHEVRSSRHPGFRRQLVNRS